jgi:hypothetical protein
LQRLGQARSPNLDIPVNRRRDHPISRCSTVHFFLVRSLSLPILDQFFLSEDVTTHDIQQVLFPSVLCSWQLYKLKLKIMGRNREISNMTRGPNINRALLHRRLQGPMSPNIGTHCRIAVVV